ncbi:MAG: fucose isomerase, partial [Candidatus Hodarchaeota archaeon]
MKQEITIGVVCFGRITFDYKAARAIFDTIKLELKKIESVNWEIIEGLLIEVEDAQQAAHYLATKKIDGLICISGTFALGHLILELNKEIRKPILLWGLEELPYDGGKIRLNSVCGINLNASNLYKAGVKNYHVIIGPEMDMNWVDAIRIEKAFNSAHIGILGFRAKGFFNLDVDELDLYRQTGVLIDHFELNEVFSLNVDEKQIFERKKQIKSIFDVSGITQEQLNKVAILAIKFEQFMLNHRLDALAIRCWPEFAEQYGISPCAAMSILQS